MKAIMKRISLILSCLAGLLFAAACVEFYPNENEAKGFDSDYDFTYGLRSVLEVDPGHPAGIDIVDKLDFFATYKMKLYVEDGTICAVEFTNDQMPFDVYPFSLPTGKVAARYDAKSVPPTLKLASGEVIAQFLRGEFVVPFHLDYDQISYTYYFKTLETTRENR
jgi:hypothetical protein